jgi:hypothetical protein
MARGGGWVECRYQETRAAQEVLATAGQGARLQRIHALLGPATTTTTTGDVDAALAAAYAPVAASPKPPPATSSGHQQEQQRE